MAARRKDWNERRRWHLRCPPGSHCARSGPYSSCCNVASFTTGNNRRWHLFGEGEEAGSPSSVGSV